MSSWWDQTKFEVVASEKASSWLNWSVNEEKAWILWTIVPKFYVSGRFERKVLSKYSNLRIPNQFYSPFSIIYCSRPSRSTFWSRTTTSMRRPPLPWNGQCQTHEWLSLINHATTEKELSGPAATPSLVLFWVTSTHHFFFLFRWLVGVCCPTSSPASTTYCRINTVDDWRTRKPCGDTQSSFAGFAL